MRVVIIGGVAAGAGAAARLRRLDERCDILLLERGPYISYANCGIPYHMGGIIPDREALLVMPALKFARRFDVDVRTGSEALAIDRRLKEVTVKAPDGSTHKQKYDKLLIATGSSPVVPAIPGADLPPVHPLWTIPDLDALVARIGLGARTALVVGGGFIGVEAAENLAALGIRVTLVELMDQILPTLDREMTVPLQTELTRLGVELRLGRKVAGLHESGNGVVATLDDGQTLAADVVILAVGVRPNSELAAAAGLDLGSRGHILVDDHLRTSDRNIYAAGDVVAVRDPLLGGTVAIPLAGPANKQARVVADNLVGRDSRYHGTYGASVVKIGDQVAASVGFTERRLRETGAEYRKLYLIPKSHAGYYPGSTALYLKLVFSPRGAILGAQAVGGAGADKRIDVIATAMRGGLTVRDLADVELSYAPPFNSAKDPVNHAGMIASNILDGDTIPVYPDAIPGSAVLLDLREKEEVDLGRIPGSVHIPLESLRGRLAELDRDAFIVAYCQSGLRAYIAERLLRQHGFNVANLSGGYGFWRLWNPEER